MRSSICRTRASGMSVSTLRTAARTSAMEAFGARVVLTATVICVARIPRPVSIWAKGKYTCTRFFASSPSCLVWPTTPTMSIHSSGFGVGESEKAMRFPIGSCPGK